MEYIQNTNKKKSIQQVIIESLEKIFELSTREFTGGHNKTIVQGNYTTKEYVPSPREEYMQAVRSFAYIIMPFFDEEMQKAYDNIIKRIDNLQEGIKKKRIEIAKKEFEINSEWRRKKELDSPDEEELEQEIHNIEALDYNDLKYNISVNKLNLMEELFMQLNQLLKRKSYLKGETYSDEMLEDEEGEEVND